MINTGLFFTSKGQTGYSYNFNINNGLPSNLIYEVITDRHGYLWIATSNGVVRYNGYDFKVFTTADGLPTNDIWQLLEDNKGRIWLGNISDEFGYLYDSKYHKTFLKGEDRTVYPKDIRVNGDGLIFYSTIGTGSKLPSICVEKNDTIYIDTFCTNAFDNLVNLTKPYNDNNTSKSIKYIYINSLGKVYLAYNSIFSRVDPAKGTNNISKMFEINPTFFEDHICSGTPVILGNYLVSYSGKKNDPFLYILNIADGHISQIQLNKYCNLNSIEYIANCQDNLQFFVVSKNDILLFNYKDSIKYNHSIDLNSIGNANGIDGTKIRAFGNFINWGNIFGSISSGIYVAYIDTNKFQKCNIPDLQNYKLLGVSGDSMSFWWDGTTQNIRTILGNGTITDYRSKYVSRLRSITNYANDSILINGSPSLLLTLHNKNIILLPDTATGHSILYSIRIDKFTNAVIASSGFFIQGTKNNKYFSNPIDRDKYSGLIYDSLRKLFFAYNPDKIYIHGPLKDTSLTKKSFSSFGVKKVQQLVVDNADGNYIFKGPDNLTLYDPDKNNYIYIFKNINLSECSILLHKHTIISFGKFGIGFCKITGRLKVSGEIIYKNINNINYRSINNCAAYFGKLLVATENGNYSVPIPADNAFTNSKNEDYAKSVIYLYKYKDSTKQLNAHDTIRLDQNDRKLQFDIINPYGNGRLHYWYKMDADTVWQQLNSNELNLPLQLISDKHYTLLLKVNDDVWKSDPAIITFYFNPYWYQTKSGNRALWVLIAVITIAILGTAILMTRNLVLNAAKKRTMRLELELKAIYSQINPHFIFNTLNSAMMMAKKSKADDIYEHISKFSSLLRAYIKSSRNKLITIEEETENIKDYIELQQARFKNRFNFSISIDDNIKPNQIRIPSLLIQPFVENAINHGLLPLEKNGFLKIDFLYEKDNNQIICIIDDNGIGRKNSKIFNENNNRKGESYGDLLIKDLVAIFNRYETMNIEIAYLDKNKPDSGTTVTIKIKNPQHAE